MHRITLAFGFLASEDVDEEVNLNAGLYDRAYFANTVEMIGPSSIIYRACSS